MSPRDKDASPPPSARAVPSDVASLKAGAIPRPVKSAYVPSGKTEPTTLPKLFLAGSQGLAIGLVAALIIGFIGASTLKALHQAATRNMLVGLAFLGGLLFYFLAPVIPFVVIGTALGGKAKELRCRSPRKARLASLVPCAIAAPVLVLLAPFYAKMADIIEEPLPAAVAYALVGLIVAAKISASAVRGQKFCESCQEYRKEQVLGWFSLEDLKPLLVTLYTGSAAPSSLKSLSPGDGKPDTKNWAKVSVFSCSCQTDHLVEVLAEVGTKTDHAGVTICPKLVFSSRVPAITLAGLRGEAS